MIRVMVWLRMKKYVVRATELINRTNQFNTTGARATNVEISSCQSGGRLLVAELDDRFGNMGIISALVFHSTPGQLTVSHFVLSCRAFGFGVEDVMLSLLKRRATRVSAKLVKSAVNQPCHDVYSRNGFRFQEGQWISEGVKSQLLPDWLKVEDRIQGAGP